MNTNITLVYTKEQMELLRKDESSLEISTVSLTDMVPIYEKLICMYSKAPDLCPTLVIVEDIFDGMSYVKCSDILLLKRGVPLDESMMSDNYFKDDLSFCSFSDSSYDIYALSLIACNRMKIRCPIILPIEPTDNNSRGQAFSDSSGLTKLIMLRPGLDYLEMLEVLFHELRHAWQNEKHHHKYYDNYMGLHSDSEKKEYLSQPAEIDAEAFSVRMMVDLGMETYPVTRWSFEDINRKIEAKAKRMCFPNPSLSYIYGNYSA